MSSEDHKSDVTLREIYNQVDACAVTLELADQRYALVERFLPLEQYTEIVLTGCGSSYNLAKSAGLAWSTLLRRPVQSVAASELLFSPELYLSAGARPLVIAISRTGATTEVRLAIERLRSEYGARALAATGQAESPVGAVSDAEIAFTECYEESIVMTQAFTCMLTGLYALADRAAGSKNEAEIRRIPGLISESLERTEISVRPIAEQDDINAFFFLGSEVMKGLADECALKMTEMALCSAVGHRSLEFRHGTKAILDEKSQVVVFPIPAEEPYLDTLLCEIHETGARTLVVRDAFGWTEPGLDYLQTGGELSNTFRPAVYVHIGQLLACRRAIWKGLSANSPRHLSRTVLLDV